MVPNNVVLVRRGRPAARARRGRPARPPARRTCTPSDVQALLEEHVADARCAASRTSRSRRSTATRSSSASQATPGRDGRRPAAGRRGPRGRRRRSRATATRTTRRGDGATRRLAPAGRAVAPGRWPTASRGDRPLAAEPALQRAPTATGRDAPAKRGARAACGSGATSISARSCSIARTTARGDVLGRARADVAAAARRPTRANIPASRMKPGKTTRDADAVPRRSSRRPSAKPRRPNFVAAVDATSPAAPALPDSEDMNTRWPHAARDHRARPAAARGPSARAG